MRLQTKKLISVCRSLFTTYGAPDEFSTDGGPQLTSNAFKAFLLNWGVHHRLSSAEYPQSNGRAELGVKSSKRILYDNISNNGSIDNDRVSRAILQYRNTPLPDINLSPAQILFHRQLRDHLPAHPHHYRLHQDWILSAKQREAALHNRNIVLAEDYNKHVHALPPLPVGTSVVIQNRGKKHPRMWTKTGRIVETLPNRQYQIRIDVSGRITLQNRRFIRKVVKPTPKIMPSITPVMDTPTAVDLTIQDTSTPPELATQVPPKPTTGRLLQRLASHNAPGRCEQQPLPPKRLVHLTHHNGT